ncbi:MAG: PDZ domain-containing protein [Planctomycetaceae bacterium]|nr:PDZ domain-containing protein [Planctomycetaceae bacterium]
MDLPRSVAPRTKPGRTAWQRSHWSRVAGAGLCLLMAWSTGSLGAADPPTQIRPLLESYFTNGAATRRAFTEVVEDANRWTVRIRSEQTEIAFGVIVRSEGYILTKGSGLRGRLECEIPQRGIVSAELVAYHPDHDLALIKVDAGELPVVRWQDADDPGVGRWAITPDGQGAPRTVGVISIARRAVPEVRISGVLGVQLDPQHESAKITRVVPDSAAARAGLQEGDIITRVNHVNVTSSSTLVAEIRGYPPQDTISLLVVRNGEPRTIQATLTHPFGDFLSRIAQQNEMGGRLSDRRTGFPAVLQHDSVLKPEECGGPLVDLSGAAIGVNIARAGRTETYAIPDDVVRSVIDELLSGQYPPPRTKLAGATPNTEDVPTSTTGGQ